VEERQRGRRLPEGRWANSIAGREALRQTGPMRAVLGAGLPAGYVARRATVTDAEIIYGVQAAHETPIIGGPNATVEDVADELAEPDFDLDTDGYLVFTSEPNEPGEPVGWTWACRKADSDNLDISFYLVPGHEVIGDWLLDTALARAAEIGRELGHRTLNVDIGSYPADKVVNDRLSERGFARATTFNRMRIDHVLPVAFPDTPAGVELRHGVELQVRKDALLVRDDSFSDHFGSVPRTFEQWAADREASSSHDWAMLHVAYVDDVPAALLLRTNNFVPDENCGYVLTLGTAHAYQGRGLGSHLLRYAFAADAADGRVGTILHVDTNPQRPALGLYQRAGMRLVLIIDVWRATLSL
jgi:mycothiol synthase